MGKNRINLKELSELLAKEVENGNGDAYLFVGEYYITKDNWTENYFEDNENKVKTLTTPYNIYIDTAVKEKIAALNYLHVQKLTEEENAELLKAKKSDPKKKKRDYYTFAATTDIAYQPYQWENAPEFAGEDAAVRRDNAEQTVEQPTERTGLNEMFDYIDYLRSTITYDMPDAVQLRQTLDQLADGLNANNLENTTNLAEALAISIENIRRDMQNGTNVAETPVAENRVAETPNMIENNETVYGTYTPTWGHLYARPSVTRFA